MIKWNRYDIDCTKSSPAGLASQVLYFVYLKNFRHLQFCFHPTALINASFLMYHFSARACRPMQGTLPQRISLSSCCVLHLLALNWLTKIVTVHDSTGAPERKNFVALSQTQRREEKASHHTTQAFLP